MAEANNDDSPVCSDYSDSNEEIEIVEEQQVPVKRKKTVKLKKVPKTAQRQLVASTSESEPDQGPGASDDDAEKAANMKSPPSSKKQPSALAILKQHGPGSKPGTKNRPSRKEQLRILKRKMLDAVVDYNELKPKNSKLSLTF